MRSIFAKHNNWNGDIYYIIPAAKGLIFGFWVITEYGERNGQYSGQRTVSPAETFQDAIDKVNYKYSVGHPPVEEDVVKHWNPIQEEPAPFTRKIKDGRLVHIKS